MRDNQKPAGHIAPPTRGMKVLSTLAVLGMASPDGWGQPFEGILSYEISVPASFYGGYGARVSRVGDIDGDGLFDYVIAHSGTGIVYARRGHDGATIHETAGNSSLAGAYGSDLAALGDVSGDGLPDYAVGAASFAAAPASSGYVTVVRHDGTTWLQFVGPPDTVPSFFGGTFGWQVSAVGDINLDGYPDVLIGHSSADGGFANAGEIQVRSGFDGSLLLTIAGTATNQGLGSALARGGDLDQDGFDDILDANFADSTAAMNAGVVRAFSGKTGAPLWSAFGTHVTELFGADMAAIADVNGDGTSDVVVGTFGLGNGGGTRVAVCSGSDGSSLVDIPMRGTGLVRDASDFDGDGSPDFLTVGKQGESGPIPVRIHSASDGTLLYRRPFTYPMKTSLAIPADLLGDIDGDGLSDVIATYPPYDSNSIWSTVSHCGAVTTAATCPGPTAPTLSVDGCVFPGLQVHLRVAGATPLGQAWLAVGSANPSAACPILIAPQAVHGPFGLSPGGEVSVPLGIPSIVAPGSVLLQGFVVNSSGLTGTAAVSVTVP